MRRFDLRNLCQLLNSLMTDKDSQGHWGQGRDRRRGGRHQREAYGGDHLWEAKAGQLASVGLDFQPACE